MQRAILADKEVDRTVSFREFLNAIEEGVAVPIVFEDDLKRLHEAWVGMTKRSRGKDGAMGLDQMARACNPGADLPAVWLRYRQLRLLAKQGFLAEWQHSMDFEDAVYEVAATIPISGFNVNPEAFIQRLRDEYNR